MGRPRNDERATYTPDVLTNIAVQVTPRVGPFKKGAFHLAKQGDVPVVPIVIRNTGRLQWRGSSTIRPGVVETLVLPPVYPSQWSSNEFSCEVQHLQSQYVAALQDWDAAVRNARA
jgi:putative phosphoserine phosphatase/1-acylglycerol-3-phosphate O-acyltransferase